MRRPGTIFGHADPFLDFHAARRLETRPRAEASRAWQFMDTAPRDGTPILVWVKWQNAPHSAAIVSYEVKQWVRVGMRRSIAEDAISHWMPLPDGPDAHEA
jgi:hypothetical protein